MVPGLAERDQQATELRRRDLLAEAAWERRLAAGAARTDGGARRSVGALLLRLGGWMRGPGDTAAIPAPAIDASGAGS